MATRRTQARVYLTLASAYRHAIENGLEKVAVHVDWIADALAYMNPSDESTGLISTPPDDMTTEELSNLLNSSENPDDMLPKGDVC